MLSARSEFAIALALTCVLGLPARSWAQDRPVHEPAATGTRGELPAALQEVPAGQVVVSYVDSKLTIKARNAPFIDVLREVCSQLGTELDAPSDADDPVLAVWGPGAPREVLAALLRHSRFDYALAASADDRRTAPTLSKRRMGGLAERHPAPAHAPGPSRVPGAGLCRSQDDRSDCARARRRPAAARPRTRSPAPPSGADRPTRPAMPARSRSGR